MKQEMTLTEPTSKAYEFENKVYLAGTLGAALGIPENERGAFNKAVAQFSEPDYSTPFAEKVLAITDEIAELLVTKNAAYGDSALNPIRVFSKGSVEDMLNVRADDKLSRIARGDGTGDEDAEMDLIGYLILKRVNRMEES